MFRVFVYVLSMLMPAMAWAEATNLSVEAPAGASADSAAAVKVEANDDTRWFAFLEFRPSYGSKVGEWHTEDTVEAGYYFNKKDRLYYSQWFLSNLFQPSVTNDGSGIRADDGALRLRLEEIYKDGDFRIAYRNRIYAPTKKVKRDIGFMTSIRNDIVAIQKLSDFVSMDFAVIPTLHFYDRDGANNEANPMFGQQFVWNVDVKITDQLRFSLPLIYEITKYRNFQTGAKLNDTWGHNLWIWPELNYDINSTHTVGISYYSGNAMTNDGALQIGKGLETGVYQLLWGVNL